MSATTDTHGTRLVTALDRGWKAIRRNHPEIPEVVIVTGRRRHRGEATLLGQHCCDTWNVNGDRKKLAEVLVTGEALADGGAEAMTTLIHEAAHALAKARKLQETSNKNRYHNTVFAALAEELGLERPKASGGPAMGWSECTITHDTINRYRRQIEAIDAAAAFVRPAKAEVRVSKPRRYAECACGEEARISWTRQLENRTANGNPVLCGTCKSEFEEVME